MNEAILSLFGAVFYGLLVGIPAAQILHRTGFSRWYALLLLLPLVGVVGLWIFAFGPWRAEFGNQKSERKRMREVDDNWSDADKEAFRMAMNRPRS
jgi:hypothetical protein